jgi:hypothetical protein
VAFDIEILKRTDIVKSLHRNFEEVKFILFAEKKSSDTNLLRSLVILAFNQQSLMTTHSTTSKITLMTNHVTA